ncbi:MAG: invasion associated locus B family protein [Alphaproteobacteria bacterium]|nr:invasion associated locus B family protein [Alphaproteobacteria bacterium]MBL7098982.1 invasion associated locus B family protein [Alphaproteobacteria bacterium]
MKSIRKIVALALGILSFAPAAFAQEAPPAAPVQPSETKPFGDWTVRCYPVKSPSPCDMFELLANKQTQQRVLSVSIAYVPARDAHVIQIAVPLGVSIPRGLLLASDSYTSPVLKYRRCDRGGCYVEMLMQNDAVTALAGAGTSAKVKVFAVSGKEFDIPFSLNGFSDAHGAMQDLARKKVGTADATPPAAPAPAAPPATPPATPAPDNTTTPTP